MRYIEYWLPIVICIESILASIPFFYVGRIGSGSYWLFAGLITAAVTFLIPKFG